MFAILGIIVLIGMCAFMGWLISVGMDSWRLNASQGEDA